MSRGENIVLTAKFTGDPVPERRWFYGKMEIKDGMGSVGIADKVDYEFLVKHVMYIAKYSLLTFMQDHTSKLTMFNARPDDSGQYEFRVENEFGEETALIDVR